MGTEEALLVNAIRCAMKAYPSMRLGQILSNAITENEADLFNIENAGLAKLIFKYSTRSNENDRKEVAE